MKIENGTFCPLVKGKCKQLECTWFIQLRGVNPNTGKEVDEWDCSIKWLPMLLVENAKEVRHGAAATESFRNEMVRLSTDGMTHVHLTQAHLTPSGPNDDEPLLPFYPAHS